jgi:hypothetical protein
LYSYFRRPLFGPEMARIMGDVFERVTRSLHDTGQPDLIKEVIAKRTIDAVRRGIRDPGRALRPGNPEPGREGRLR